MSDAAEHLAEPQINATPLIDVLLVLLVMIILTVPIATHVVDLELPHGPGQPAAAPVRLEILYGGEIFWNGRHVESVEALEPMLTAFAAQPRPPLLQVLPERFAPYETVVQVLAAARRCRVERISVPPVPDR